MSVDVTLPLSEETITKYYENGFWGHHTLYDLVRNHANRRPNGRAVTSRHRTLTWLELLEAVEAFSSDVSARGIEKGDTICVSAPNRIETIIALLTASRDGLICCPSPHKNHTVNEIAEMCRRTSCSIFIHQAGHGADSSGDEILKQINHFSFLKHVYCLSQPSAAAPFEGNLENKAVFVRPEGHPDLVSYLAFTSGSTGKPKGVMHTDNTQLVAARGIVSAWRLGEGIITCSLSPFSHNLGCGTLWTSIVCGGEFVIHDWPRDEGLLENLRAANVNYLVGVPTHAIDLLQELERKKITYYDQLISFRVSAAACPPHIAEKLYDLGIPVQKGYGMTETNGHQHGLPGDSRLIVSRTSGVCCPGHQLEIFDPDEPDQVLDSGKVGLVGCKGASLMRGYFLDADATEDSLNSSGWFLTGDLGRIDENGYLFLSGRTKDLIVRGGHNINPILLEQFASLHPAIDLVAAIPLADDRLGERACLVIRLTEGHSISGKEILKHLAEQGLSRFDMPEYWLRMDDLPLIPNGKMDKQQILQQVNKGLLSPESIR